MSRGWPYHTFVSFRGEDLRHGFIGVLRGRLQQRGIHLFMDDDIRKGENITDTLIEAIEDSQTAIIVLSKNYASSSFCLRELVHIQRCMQGHGRTIWVIFFDVDPTDVRHQKNSYETAFQRYDNDKIKYDEKEVNDWRMALTKAANVCGWRWNSSSKTNEDIYRFIEEIIDRVSEVINQRQLFIAQVPVGLESQVEELIKCLNQKPNDDGATMVGIWGPGGIGKTTLARALYNEIGKDFKHLCFLANIREKYSIRELAKTMLSQTIWEKEGSLDNVDELTIPSIIRDKLCNKKVLLILDDICELKQLQALAGEPNWFGCGSKIIITTRDIGLLSKHDIDISRTYNVELLKPDQAEELLRLHAFGKNVDPKYQDVINRAVKYAGGLPLVLEVLGSHLSARQTIEDWEGVLDMYERIPEKTVLKTLRVSYDGLEQIQQQIFLDIACFYRGESLEYVTNILASSHDFPHPESCIRVLIERSLLKIDEDTSVQMHDLIQDMGQAIVRQESTELGKCSRLWSEKDFRHVLETDSGSGSIQVIKLHDNLSGSPSIDVNWNGEAFRKMTCLRQLTITSINKFSRGPQYLPNSLRVLEWDGYPSWTLPQDFHPYNLAILKLTQSELRTLDRLSKKFENLRNLNLADCEWLKEIPDISTAANLESLKVENCTTLTKIHDSVGHLKKLRVLVANRCKSLTTFIEGGIKLPSLESVSLSQCSILEKFPQIFAETKNLKALLLDYCRALKELPESSIENLVGLERLNLGHCSSLPQLPLHTILKLKKLEKLDASYCNLIRNHSLEHVISSVTILWLEGIHVGNEVLVKILSSFPNLTFLSLRFSSGFTELPKCIENCHNLKVLYLDWCSCLGEISGVLPKLQELSAINCSNMTSHTRNLFLCQALHETGGTRYILPGNEIPEWFHKQSDGDSVSFSFRNKFPDIALCVVFPLKLEWQFGHQFQIILNGTHRIEGHWKFLLLKTDHIYLFDLKSLGPQFSLENEGLKEEWNQVVIKCHCNLGPISADGAVKCIGVYAYNYDKCNANVDWNNATSEIVDRLL